MGMRELIQKSQRTLNSVKEWKDLNIHLHHLISKWSTLHTLKKNTKSYAAKWDQRTSTNESFSSTNVHSASIGTIIYYVAPSAAITYAWTAQNLWLVKNLQQQVTRLGVPCVINNHQQMESLSLWTMIPVRRIVHWKISQSTIIGTRPQPHRSQSTIKQLCSSNQHGEGLIQEQQERTLQMQFIRAKALKLNNRMLPECSMNLKNTEYHSSKKTSQKLQTNLSQQQKKVCRVAITLS